jgi:hypothetical protein
MTIAQELGFSPLLLPDPKCHAIDVVFIHGLNGHRSKTWKNESSETWPLWLRDDLDGVRAWTYGYDASIAVRSEEDVKDHSVRFLDAMVSKRVGKSASHSLYFVVRYIFVNCSRSRRTLIQLKEQCLSFSLRTAWAGS